MRRGRWVVSRLKDRILLDKEIVKLSSDLSIRNISLIDALMFSFTI